MMQKKKNKKKIHYNLVTFFPNKIKSNRNLMANNVCCLFEFDEKIKQQFRAGKWVAEFIAHVNMRKNNRKFSIFFSFFK